MIELAPFRQRILDECGLLFEGEKEAILAAGIDQRMRSRSVRAAGEYFDLLREEAELARLIELLTINETYFYREPAHLQILAERLLPELLPRRMGGKVRILSAGCSTGEEAYSIAITLLERFGENAAALASVIAVDIDAEALGKAREGIYGRASFRGFREELRERYFQPAGGSSFRVRPEVQKLVAFARVNLRSSPYPAVMTDLDVIFYRNVSIYFPPQIQQEVFGRLAACLSDAGFLFVSSTETLSHPVGGFPLIEIDGCFLYQRKNGYRPGDGKAGARPGEVTAEGRGKQIPPAPRWSLRPPSPPVPTRPAISDLLAEAEGLAREKRHGDALSKLNLLLERDPVCLTAHILRGSVLAHLGRLKEAAIACRRALEIERWNLEGTLLLGMIARGEGAEEEAVRCFREALYIAPSCWIAHFQLGEIHAARSEHESARREYRIVVRILEKEGAGSPFLFFPLAFEAEHLVKLCRHRLATLPAA